VPDDIVVLLGGITSRHNRAVDSFVATFEEQLGAMLTKVSARTVAQLQARLGITDGMVDRTLANQQILRRVDKIFSEQMKLAGYDGLVDSFVSAFAKQFPFFDQVIETLGLPPVSFAKADRDFFVSQQTSAADSLGAVVDTVAAVAQQKALFSVGALKIADLAETLATALKRTLPEAARLADTSMSVFYRSISDRGFRLVEEGMPASAVRYKYYGPDDLITRPFCRHVLEGPNLYTRAQIENMSNGQLPNPFLTGGGYRCRHWWLLYMQPAAAPPAVAA
jgi:hypothetical protein